MASPLVSKFKYLIYRSAHSLLRLYNNYFIFLFLRHAQLLRLGMRTVSRRIRTATFDPVGCLRVTALIYMGGRGFVSQIIEPVTFARCAFIFALRNIALGGYLDTCRNINFALGGYLDTCRNINFRTFTARRKA